MSGRSTKEPKVPELPVCVTRGMPSEVADRANQSKATPPSSFSFNLASYMHVMHRAVRWGELGPVGLLTCTKLTPPRHVGSWDTDRVRVFLRRTRGARTVRLFAARCGSTLHARS